MIVAQYKTIDGDFYDWISYKIFNTEIYAMVIASANPKYQTVVRFNSGIIITIPVVATPSGTKISKVDWGTVFLT